MRNVKCFPCRGTRVKSTSAAAALCFEIAASVAGLKKHVCSYITASEEISEKGCEVSPTSTVVKAHTLPDVGHPEEECREEL